MSNKLSYSSGTSDKPLLGNTIGQVFNNVSNKFPDREALVSVHQNIRFTYAGMIYTVSSPICTTEQNKIK